MITSGVDDVGTNSTWGWSRATGLVRVWVLGGGILAKGSPVFVAGSGPLHLGKRAQSSMSSYMPSSRARARAGGVL